MAVRLIVFIVLGLSFVNAYSFVKLYTSTFVADKNLKFDGFDRSPASIPPTTFRAEDFKKQLSVDLNCGKIKVSGLKVKSQWAQLKGRMCKSKKIAVVEITNLNNGFTASIFDLGPQEYQTDLIQLEKGTNKIRVRVVSPNGPVQEQTLEIESGLI